MCVCVCVCVCVRARVCVCVCMCVYPCACMQALADVSLTIKLKIFEQLLIHMVKFCTTYHSRASQHRKTYRVSGHLRAYSHEVKRRQTSQTGSWPRRKAGSQVQTA